MSSNKLGINEIIGLLDDSDFEYLEEDNTLEIKKAAGENGKGQLPKTFFQTYSAFANTQGGIVLLGFEELPDKTYNLTGIVETEHVLSDMWNTLNNHQKVSSNILVDQYASVKEIDGKKFIKIIIPPAARNKKPIYIGENPLKGTYRRYFAGDYLCDEDTVKRMLAEQVNESRDSTLLPNFTEDDLDKDTLLSYRNRFRNTKPTHQYNNLDDHEFLRSIGALTKDRTTDVEGLTLAGLLMFGKSRAINEAMPNYLVDYQERDPHDEERRRWIDRVFIDGTWSGNLFDFFQIVITKLYSDLKTPFQLNGISRIDETPVHEALREALVNTLVHADYSCPTPILVIKRPGVFTFRNPGTMRIPINEAILGGLSDCRNRTLHAMFAYVGYGERAGSGLFKIYQNWKEQLWRKPDLYERYEPERTYLILRMISLLPKDAIADLKNRFGSEFDSLSEEQKLALATVQIEGKVTHSRLKAMSRIHPHDLSLELRDLVSRGFLITAGATRGMEYSFPPNEPAKSEVPLMLSLSPEAVKSEHLGLSLEHLSPDLEHLELDSERLHSLQLVAERINGRGKIAKSEMELIICELCRGGYLSTKQIAQLLNRSPDTLRVHYLNQMIKTGKLELRYPDKLNHPNQAYLAK
jgi:predicted HTH transcriptional regulator/DNA-binding CsgD family transcriptional regulator